MLHTKEKKKEEERGEQNNNKTNLVSEGIQFIKTTTNFSYDSLSNPHSCCFLSSKEKLIRVQNSCLIKEVPNDAVESASTDPLFKESTVRKAHTPITPLQ